MTIDVILDIKKIEEEADQIVKKSIADSRTILADAKTQAAQIINDATSDGRRTTEEKTVLAEQRANAETEKIKRKVAHECDQIARAARVKFEEAAAIIAGRIIKLNADR